MSEPIHYLGISELAVKLRISRQRVDQLRQEGKLPPPDATTGSKSAPLWLPATAEEAARRREAAHKAQAAMLNSKWS